jgi:hypothetical protein
MLTSSGVHDGTIKSLLSLEQKSNFLEVEFKEGFLEEEQAKLHFEDVAMTRGKKVGRRVSRRGKAPANISTLGEIIPGDSCGLTLQPSHCFLVFLFQYGVGATYASPRHVAFHGFLFWVYLI